MKLPVETNITNELVGYALRGLDLIYSPEYAYKKAGVILYDIVPETVVQGNLFDEFPREKYKRLMPVVDSLNSGFDRGALKLACQVGPKKWGMKQGLRSGRFTTEVGEVIRVK